MALSSTYVDTAHTLADVVEALRSAPVIGFDTEFVGESTYEPVLCLVQVSTADGIWIIDPLVGLKLNDFWAELTAPEHEVVALAARQEVSFCLRYAKRPPAIVFDPQLAAGLVGFSYPLSHTNLVLQLLNARVGGGETFTDWRQRPLTPKQLEYAADDVRYLLDARQRLLDRAQTLGRVDWLRGEATRSVQRYVQSEGEERWERVSGASSLSPRGLAVMRELWRWRDGEARRANLPPRRVLSDDLMSEIAKRSPKTTTDLFALRGFDRPQLKKAGPELVAAVQAGLAVPTTQLPASLRRDDPPQVAILAQLMALIANGLAAQYQVASGLLATSNDFQEIVRWHLDGERSEAPQALQGWRGDLLRKPLLDLLQGNSGIRVADVHLPNPLSVEPYLTPTPPD